MQTSDMIRGICRQRGITITELCRRIGQTPQNFGKKLKRGTVTLEEIGQIACALGVRYEQKFVAENEETIGITLGADGTNDRMSDRVLSAMGGDSLLEELFESVYYVDLEDDSYIVRFRRNWLDRKYKRGGSYIGKISEWIRTDVFRDDRETMLAEATPERIRARLENGSYSVPYRALVDGGTSWREMRVINASGGREIRYITLCFIDRDESFRDAERRETEQRQLIEDNFMLAAQNNSLQNDQGLMRAAMEKIFQMCIRCNLTKDEYRVIRYTGVPDADFPVEGTCASMVSAACSSIQSEAEREAFEGNFSRDVLLRAFAAGTRYTVHRHHYKSPGGVVQWIESSAVLEQADNGDIFAVILARDVTEEEIRKHENARYHDIVENLAQNCVSMYEVDLEKDSFRILHLNSHAEAVYGTSYRREIEGMRYTEAVRFWAMQEVDPEDSDRMLREFLPKTILDNLTRDAYYSRNFREAHDGRKYFEMRVQKISAWEEDNCVLIAFYNVDEATRTRLEDEKKLKRAYDEAQAAVEAKRRFLFHMSHDIRTPMNAVIGYTDMAIRHRDDPGRLFDCLSKMRTTEEGLLHLLNDVLFVSHMESGTVTLDLKPARIRESIAFLLPTIREEASKKGVRFEFAERGMTEEEIIADIPRINEILLSILGNAVRFTPAGGRVSYLIEQYPDTGDGRVHFLFTVDDTGIGIGKEFLPHIFEPFARENPESSDGVGIGMGLNIARNLITLMGGRIEADSVPGEGSVFRVYLDFAKKEQIKAEEPAVSPEETARRLCRGRRVLLAEDNELNREILCDMLEDFGLYTDTAVNGREAVDMLAAKPADYYAAVFMDIQMPVMNGYRAAKEIRKSEEGTSRRIPIIAVTANAFDEDRKESAACGMDVHLEKPVSHEILRDQLISVFSERKGDDV